MSPPQPCTKKARAPAQCACSIKAEANPGKSADDPALGGFMIGWQAKL
jgi:hypothetical protein